MFTRSELRAYLKKILTDSENSWSLQDFTTLEADASNGKVNKRVFKFCFTAGSLQLSNSYS